jgi:hypothetical protein
MFDMQDVREEGNEDYFAMGDARRCPHHPHVKTSSDDGLFDAPCPICEGEMSEAADAWECDPANPHRRFCDAGTEPKATAPCARAPFLPNRCEPDAEDLIAF